MKTKLLLFASLFITLLFFGCSEWFEKEKSVGVETLKEVDIEPNATTARIKATLYGKATGESSRIQHRGFILSKTYKLDYTLFEEGGSGSGDFFLEVEDLDITALYYVQAYVRTADGVGGIIYGDYVPFSASGAPWVNDLTDYEGKDITGTTASISCQIVYNGGSAVTDQGIYFGTPNNPLAEKIPLTRSSDGSYSYVIHNLTPETTYCVTTYAENSAGERQSTTTFTTKAMHTPVAYIPEGGFLNVEMTSVTIRAIIEDFGGDPDTEYGIMWGKNEQLTGAGAGSMVGANVNASGGPFEITVGEGGNPLDAKTIYYFAVYIIMPDGRWVSPVSSISTASDTTPAVTTVAPVTAFIQVDQDGTIYDEPVFTDGSDYCDFINMQATVSNAAKFTVAECGFYWGTSPDNLESQHKAVATNYNNGEFSFKLNQKWSDGGVTTGDIDPLGTYYWKAFVINTDAEVSQNNDIRSTTTYIVDRRPGAETYFRDGNLTPTENIIYYKESAPVPVNLTIGGNANIIFLDRNLGAITGMSILVTRNGILDYNAAGSYFRYGTQKPQVSAAMSERSGSNGLNTAGGAFYGQLFTNPADLSVNSGVSEMDSWRTLIKKGEAKEPCPPGYTVPSWEEFQKTVITVIGSNNPNNATVIASQILRYPVTGHYQDGGTLVNPNQFHTWVCNTDNQDPLRVTHAACFNSNNFATNTANWSRDRCLAIRCVKISSLPEAAKNQ